MIYCCLEEKNVRVLGKEGFPVKFKIRTDAHDQTFDMMLLRKVLNCFFNATFYRQLLWGEFNLIALIDLLFEDCNYCKPMRVDVIEVLEKANTNEESKFLSQLICCLWDHRQIIGQSCAAIFVVSFPLSCR